MKDADFTTDMLDTGVAELKKILPMTREEQEEAVMSIYNAVRRRDPSVPKDPSDVPT